VKGGCDVGGQANVGGQLKGLVRGDPASPLLFGDVVAGGGLPCVQKEICGASL
jgi:hypothetical protein